MHRSRLVRWVTVPLALLAGSARAQEWHESYRDGLKALAQGQPQRAVTLLEYAAGQRPQPGRNVVTYGTNVEARYYPYLHLAEAYLQLRDLAGARSALERSERWGREPAEERRRLAAQVEDLAAKLAPPAPTAPPTVLPATVPPTTLPSARPPAMEATPTPTPTPPPTAVPAPPRAPRVSRPEMAPPSSCSVEIVSQPPGASVYLDEESIGTTDPEWGRLVKSGVSPGRHRIRLALAGYQDLTEEVVLGAGGLMDFRRRLSPVPKPIDQRLILFGAVALVLLALTGWALRRPRQVSHESVPRREDTFSATPTPARPTPRGAHLGVHADDQGREYFGEYRLLEPLGRGGMASVYKAERHGEIVALKRMLHTFLDEPEFQDRFLRETEIGRTLNHPNIVRVLERGEVEGVPFFTMELVAGETLRAALQREGALEARPATRIVVQVAEALDYAHLKGVVHRDLKPSNVMVLPDGTAKVMDFGIARAMRFEGLTVTGSFLGSPEYVAPEAIEGIGTDARSDLYSLGVMFYETLTGRRPFNADTPFGILRKHLSEAPPPPSLLRPGLPGELEAIVLRLLSKRPEQRHAAAEELVIELRDFLNRRS